MAYKNRIIYILLLLIVGSSSYRLSATSHSDSTRHHVPKPPPSVSTPTTVLTQRQFASLEAFVQAQAQTISTQPIHITAPAEFTEAYIRDNFTVSAAVADARDSAKAAFGQIEKSNNYVESFAMDNLLELPVGLKKRVGNSDVVIGIVKARFYEGYAEMTVFCKIDLPQKVGSDGARTIFFGADNVRFTRRGAIQGTPKLVLLGDVPIPINGGNTLLTLRGGLDMRTGQVDSMTYVKFNCNGIEEIGLAAEISFSRNLIIPLHPTTLDTLTDIRKRVKGSFKTVVRDWNDIVATIALPPFAIKSMESVAFKVGSATFDFSDMITPGDIAFPQSYTNLLPPNRSLWRGVYIKKAMMYLPEEFKLKGSTGRVAIAADSFLIDNLGLTGRVSANNVYQNGTASKWDMSLDKFELEIVTNSLRSAGFHGAIALPVTAKKDTNVSSYGMLYSAVFTSSKDYVLSVGVKDTINFDLWKAKAKLYRGTYVTLEAVGKHFSPKAVLNGLIAVTGFSKKDTTELAGIEFQEFMMQSGREREPRCSLKYGGYVVDSATSNKLMKFPLSINALSVVIDSDTSVSLRVGFGITLGDTNRFAASSTLDIIGSLRDSADRISYNFKELKVKSISLTGDFNAFVLRGAVNIYEDDPMMGKGFGGNVAMTLKMGKDTINISVALAFGRVNTYKYWYVDAAVSGFRWDVAPGLAITGLGGGAWNKMIKTEQQHPNPQMMPTGSTYTPNSSAGFGFRAMTQFVMGGKNVAQGNLCLEILFNGSGGVNRILLYGGAVIMPKIELRKLAGDNILVKNSIVSKLNKLNGDILSRGLSSHISELNDGNISAKAIAESKTPNPTAAEQSSIAIKLGIEYNFNTKVLDGNFDVNMSLANGIITGSGQARMYFAPDKWYMHIGKPSTPVNVYFNIPGIRTNAKLYFMVGTELEPSGDLPAPAVTILGPDKVQTLKMMRNMAIIGSGKGLSHGASFSANLGYDFSFIYARFGGGVGFDIMVRDYGDMRCRGYVDPIGIQGWYASGQAYAYIQGNVGIRVRLRFISKDISIISGNAALLLQSKLPKPSWFSGYLAGSYNLLGGVVRGSFNCNLTLGDNCELVNANTVTTTEQDFIKEMSPIVEVASDSVDVFAKPSVTLRIANKAVFQLEVPGTEQVQSYRANFQQLTVTNNQTGASIDGSLEWSQNETVVTFHPSELLPPETQIRVSASLHFEELVGRDDWREVMQNGVPVVETKTISFITGKVEPFLSHANIQYMYPSHNQKRYLPKETSTGFIKLKRGQPNILTATTPIQVIFHERDSIARAYQARDCRYDANNHIITYTLPILNRSKHYDADVYTHDSILILEFDFQSSFYDNFNERIAAGVEGDNIDGVGSLEVGDGVIILNASRHSPEISVTVDASTENQNSELMLATFDVPEILGTPYTDNKPLINKELILDDMYYNQGIHPHLYGVMAEYEPEFIEQVAQERRLLGLGTPPIEAMEVSIEDKTKLMTEGRTLLGSFPYEYTIPEFYEKDLENLKEEILDKYLVGGANSSAFEMALPEHAVPVIQYQYPSLPPGLYRAKLEYKLPDGTVTTVKQVVYSYQPSN